METIKRIGAWILALLIGVLTLLKLTKSDNQVESELEERREEIQDQLDHIREEEKALDENGVESLSEDEVVDYWNKNE